MAKHITAAAMEVGACGWVCWEKETEHDTGRWPVRVLRVCVLSQTFDCEFLGRAQHGQALPWSQFTSGPPPHPVPYEGLGPAGEPTAAAQVPGLGREAGVTAAAGLPREWWWQNEKPLAVGTELAQCQSAICMSVADIADAKRAMKQAADELRKINNPRGMMGSLLGKRYSRRPGVVENRFACVHHRRQNSTVKTHRDLDPGAMMSTKLVTSAVGLERGSNGWLAVAHGRATGHNAVGLAAAGARARKFLTLHVGAEVAGAALGCASGVDAAGVGGPKACAAVIEQVLSRGGGAPAALSTL